MCKIWSKRVISVNIILYIDWSTHSFSSNCYSSGRVVRDWDIGRFLLLTGNGKSAERHAAGQGDRGHERRAGVSQHEEKRGFHAKTAAVEYLPDASRGQDTVFSYVIGQQTSKGHHYGHQQMRQSSDVTGLRKWKHEHN